MLKVNKVEIYEGGLNPEPLKESLKWLSSTCKCKSMVFCLCVSPEAIYTSSPVILLLLNRLDIILQFVLSMF